MDKQKNEENSNVTEIKVADLKNEKWPGRKLGQDFTMVDGKKLLTGDFLKKIKKPNFDVLAIIWPKKKTDSYVDITCRVTLVFAKNGSTIKITTWNPWEDFCSKKVKDGLKLRIEKFSEYKVLEIHRIQGRSFVRYVENDGSIAEFPLEANFDFDKTNPKKVYFGRRSRIIADYLTKKKK